MSRISEALEVLSLEDILEMNNLTEEEVLEMLFEAGLIAYPESIFRD